MMYISPPCGATICIDQYPVRKKCFHRQTDSAHSFTCGGTDLLSYETIPILNTVFVRFIPQVSRSTTKNVQLSQLGLHKATKLCASVRVTWGKEAPWDKKPLLDIHKSKPARKAYKILSS